MKILKFLHNVFFRIDERKALNNWFEQHKENYENAIWGPLDEIGEQYEK